jgi:CheY-like chemotaxis protein
MKQVFLYVEDDALSCEIMQIMMEGLGQTLVVFEDSTDFMTRVETLTPQPNIIFLDIHVQPYSGFDMLSMLRQNPTHEKTKVVALTASVMNEEIARLKTSGFNGAIGKPLDFEQFPQLLEKLTRGDEVWHIS